MRRLRLGSAAVASVGYDGRAHVLELEFRSGAVYQYAGVPMSVYHDLLTAPSPAHYLQDHIKAAGYPYRRVAPPRDADVATEEEMMAYDWEAGRGNRWRDAPTGDRYYGPAEWSRQGDGELGARVPLGGADNFGGVEFERADLEGAGPHAGRGPRSWRRPRERVEEEVNEALTRDPEVDATEILVTVNDDNEVMLEGTVANRGEKRHAEDLAAAVPGVSDVQNRLRIA
ncbi:MAG TPA: KTSC domain-containing protein [Gemmatimonadales bacterium]|nr:KTSC domain-containing protein [Gemmatimonadales bacterium]